MIEIRSVIQPFLTPQTLERLPKVVNGVLIFILAATLAHFTWVLVPLPVSQETIPAVQKSPARAAAPVRSARVGDMHLFGKPPEIPVNAPVAQVEVPVTRLNLTLMGVLASNSPLAKAIISDSSGEENFYSIGDQVPGGAVLQEIHADHVMLMRNNKLEALKLPDETDANVNYVPPPMPVAPAAMGGGNTNTALMSTGSILKDWQQKLDSDPQSLMNLVRAEPVNRGGKLVGYRVMPGRDRHLLQKFGLRAGDIVMEVNSVPLDNPLKGLEVLNNLKAATQVTLGVERNGNRETMVFQVEQ